MTERKKYKISPKIKVNFFKDKSDQRKNSQAHTSSHFKRIKKNVIKNIKMSIARASIVVKKILSYQELSFEQFQSTLIHSSFFLLFLLHEKLFLSSFSHSRSLAICIQQISVIFDLLCKLGG